MKSSVADKRLARFMPGLNHVVTIDRSYRFVTIQQVAHARVPAHHSNG